jgi:hypothetical protein
MARILTSTRGLAHHLKTDTWDERLPRVFEITEERLQRVRTQAPPIQSDEKWGVKPVASSWLGSLLGKMDIKEDVDMVRGL